MGIKQYESRRLDLNKYKENLFITKKKITQRFLGVILENKWCLFSDITCFED
jgi:hypothetical protein